MEITKRELGHQADQAQSIDNHQTTLTMEDEQSEIHTYQINALLFK
jgi:hypothetical protein